MVIASANNPSKTALPKAASLRKKPATRARPNETSATVAIHAAGVCSHAGKNEFTVAAYAAKCDQSPHTA